MRSRLRCIHSNVTYFYGLSRMSLMTDIRAFVFVCRFFVLFVQTFPFTFSLNVISNTLVLLLQLDHFGITKKYFINLFKKKSNIETNILLRLTDRKNEKTRRNKSDTKLKVNQKSVFLSTKCNELLRLPRSTYPSKYSHIVYF